MTIVPADAQPSLLARIAATERPDLIVLIGYGDELAVFRHARALWQFYVSHFPRVEVIFTRSTNQLARGEVRMEGNDLLVGLGKDFDGAAGYAASGVWSISENAKWIFRQMMVQDYLLRTRERPFFLYHTTATSVVDFRALGTVLDRLPATDCYAGPIGRLNAPADLAGLTFCSGASTLMSRDVLVRLRERYDPAHAACQLPNDIWQAVLLDDVARTALPTFNFIKTRAPRAAGAPIAMLAKLLLQQGHFHFRVKTVEPADAAGRREDVDPWIMLRIMEAVLDSEPVPAATLALMDHCAHMLDHSDGRPLPPRTATPLSAGARTLPLNDLEIDA